MAPDDAGQGTPGTLRGTSAREARVHDQGRGGARRGSGGGGGGLVGGGGPQVPEADFRSYYGRPILKAPVWEWDIPAYLFTGGLAGGSSLLAAGASVTGRDDLRRATRSAALVGIGASTYFLINDLGRPERFYNMLRIVRVTSPMSVGTWILSVYGPAAGAAAAAELAPLLPERGVLGLARRLAGPVGSLAGWAAAATAPALATYTAVLLADTAAPAWHDAHRLLPFVFGGSALASGGGVGMLAAPLAQAGPARRMAVAGAAVELVAERLVETRLGLSSEAFHEDAPRRKLRASQALTVAGAVGAVLGRRSRVVSALSGLALLSGSALTRFGVFDAGVASTKDPRYVVVPQRERVRRGEPVRA
ncbi:NrfD/PsrC family molybdoenzyme membrane anchor subunit [Vallicoccus soli]|uniref:Polysulfide reductase n=1 Tax=Vallicoccus soli TaxID=2339232 RepID=A0A3A3YYN5_9ACTN|nr:NrfD/PsrC family molybdoenzyme membrane anchor subunit [Vallicoccus soli]RJK94238.1 hypothetical protein D5H78_14690 [Vallicoccus soli]